MDISIKQFEEDNRVDAENVIFLFSDGDVSSISKLSNRLAVLNKIEYIS